MTPEEYREKFPKLPKWVQKHIKVLENRLRGYADEIKDLTRGPTRIFYGDHFIDPDVRYIPEDPIKFNVGTLEDPNLIEISFAKRGNHTFLCARTPNANTVAVRGEAGNSVLIEVIRREEDRY